MPLVLDSYALLEFVLDQPKAPVVRELLDRAASGACKITMSWINASETYYMLARKRSTRAAEDFLDRVASMPLRLVVPDVEDILNAARIKAQAKLSYADSFAVALAVALKGSIVTGDPEIRALDLVQVVWVGPAYSERRASKCSSPFGTHPPVIKS